MSIAWSHNSKTFFIKDYLDLIIATCAKFDNHINFYKAEDGQLIQKFEVLTKGSTVTGVQFSSNSKLLVFCGDDSSVGVLNTMQHKVESYWIDHEKNT